MSFTRGSLGKLTQKKSVRLAYWIHSCAKEGPDRNRINAAVMTEIRRMMYPPKLFTSSWSRQKRLRAETCRSRADVRSELTDIGPLHSPRCRPCPDKPCGSSHTRRSVYR